MDKDRKKNEILQAALKLFARFGYQKTTVDDVAAEAGMSKGNVYFYVSSKRELYEKAVSNALQQWRDTVGDAVAEVDDVVENSPS